MWNNRVHYTLWWEYTLVQPLFFFLSESLGLFIYLFISEGNSINEETSKMLRLIQEKIQGPGDL